MWTYAGSRVRMYFIYQCAQNNTFSILNHQTHSTFDAPRSCTIQTLLCCSVRSFGSVKYPPTEEHFNNYYFANFSSIFLAYKLLFFNPFYPVCCCLSMNCVHLYMFALLPPSAYSGWISIFFPVFSVVVLLCVCVQHKRFEDVRCRKSEIVNYLLTRVAPYPLTEGRKDIKNCTPIIGYN